MGGTNSSLMPWMRCLPTLWPVRSVGLSAGSSGCTFTSGTAARRQRPTPMTVPPVPTPATKAVGRKPSASSWRSSSGPVVCRWASTLAALSNWRGWNTRRSSRLSASAWAMAPLKPPCSAVTGTTVAPSDWITSSRSRLIQSGMKMRTSWPSARPMAAKAMPVLPLVASAMTSPGSTRPLA